VISVFVNQCGYFIQGGGFEIARSCPRDDCNSELYHEYKILLIALTELIGKKQNEDIIVYNNTRIIDEMNGSVPPLDDTCLSWQRCIRREILPHITSIVFFAKKSLEYINHTINDGFQMLLDVDPQLKQKALKNYQEFIAKEQNGKRKGILDRFRKRWLGE
jgi:hypothetical protein